MKKNSMNGIDRHWNILRKALFAMKLTTLIFLISTLSLMAGESYSQDTRISLNLKNVQIKDVLLKIEDSSEFFFIYNNQLIDVDRNVSVNADNEKISDVLHDIFRDQKVEFQLSDRKIVIVPTEILNQQSQTKVSGKVTDSSGGPLPGVSVVVKGTTNGTITDSNGNYSVSNLPANAILQFSFVGMKTQEIAVGNKTNINVEMLEETIGLDEVVAVGYGTMKKSDLTGSVTSISNTVIQSRPVINFVDALKGRTSGVNISQTGGDLNGKFSVTIRGAGAITTSSSPLIIIDGITMPGTNLNTINAKDIVAIDVLKDASATSIYGAQAANGVLLITTKRGKEGDIQINFNADFGTENISKLYDVLSTEQQRQLFVEAFKNAGRSTSAYENIANPVWKINNNWQKLATRSALNQNYNLQISGGNSKSRFVISGGYSEREGVVKNTDISNYFFRSNNDINFSKKVKIASSFMANYQIYNQPQKSTDVFNSGGLFENLVSQHSYNPAFDESGNLSGVVTAADPYFGAIYNPLIPIYLYNNQSKNTKILGSVKVDYEILNGLVLSGSAGLDLTVANSYSYVPKYTIGLNKTDYGTTGSGGGQTYNWVSDLTLEYQKTYGLHSVKILAGMSAQQLRDFWTNTSGWGTTDNSLNQISNQQNFSASSADVKSGLASTFARLNYNFNERYLLTATVRRDGSSKFGPTNRYGVFPSASAAWRISKEKFFNVESISDLKLRVSYGLTGNQNIGDFGFMSQVTSTNYVYGNTIVGGNIPRNMSNPNLKWESAKQLDAGLDVSFLSGRVNFIVDYYDKKSENLLVSVPLPLTASISSQITNFGSIQNKGLEFSFNSVNISKGPFTWSTDFNIAYNKNEVLNAGSNSIGEGLTIPGNVLALPNDYVNLTRAGRSVGEFYMYRFIGIWQTNQANEAAVAGAVPGDARYADLNNNGKLDDGDKAYVGSAQPVYFGGLNNTWTYKNLSLNIFLNFSGGNKVYNTMRNLNARAVPFNQQLAEVADFWTPTNPSNTVPRPSQGGNSTFLSTRVSTRFLEDGSYLRLKNISLAYSLPTAVTNKLNLQAAKLSVSCINVFTLTRYKGLDPEAASQGNLLSAGLDMTPYPPTRQISMSLSITF